MLVKIVQNEKGRPAGKVADAELHFDYSREDAGRVLPQGRGTDAGLPAADIICEAIVGLAGLRLVGFSIWEQGDGRFSVTFPSRSFAVNGERRSFMLLRAISDESARDRLRDLILQAYAESRADVTAEAT